MRQELREWIEELAIRAGLDGLPPRTRIVALSVVAALVVIALWWWGAPVLAPGGAPDDATGAGAGEEASASAGAARPSVPASVTVHVVGAVLRPGVYVLDAGSRVCDAVAAAGGLLGSADQAGINLARAVTDGEQLVVPVQGQAAPSPAGAGGGTPKGGRVDLNSATAEQLDALPGVGPATAAKIVADREANGPFRTAEDLMRVSGIGAKRFEALQDLVTVR